MRRFCQCLLVELLYAFCIEARARTSDKTKPNARQVTETKKNFTPKNAIHSESERDREKIFGSVFSYAEFYNNVMKSFTKLIIT